MQEKNNLFRKISVLTVLVKNRLSLAVTLSAVTGYLMFRNTPGSDLMLLIPGIFLLVAGSAALNQYMEREQDAIMARTMQRPLPAKKITPGAALKISLFLLISGSSFLLAEGFIPFALGCIGVILYNLLYTSLKKTTFLAIIPGALVGAIPPLIGYASAGGTFLNNGILLFSVFMFLWQIPHFWLLLIRFGKEYQRAGFRTIYDSLSVKQIRNLVFIWVCVSVACICLFSVSAGITGKNFSALLAFLSLLFVALFYKSLFIRADHHNFKLAFILFNSYSIMVMLLLISDSLLS